MVRMVWNTSHARVEISVERTRAMRDKFTVLVVPLDAKKKIKIVLLWIDRFKGVLLEASLFFHPTMWCFLSWSLKNIQKTYLTPFAPYLHVAFDYFTPAVVNGGAQTRIGAAPLGILEFDFAQNSITQGRHNGKYLWNGDFETRKCIIHLFAQSPLNNSNLRCKNSMKPPAWHLWDDRFRMFLLHFLEITIANMTW